MQDQHTMPNLILTVNRQDLPFYTTLLQSGVEIKSTNNETMGHLLNRLPGFTMDYVADTVQTIFLNGTAVDDLTTPLGSDDPVLAISAAMPGLAGAIFRRNSFHAALRTNTETPIESGDEAKPTLVTLKLFNSIALERGTELLEMGVIIKTAYLKAFLAKRATLFEKAVQVELTDSFLEKEKLTELLSETDKINLKIITTHG